MLREVLKRFPRLRLLLGGEVDAVAREERAGLRGDLERLVRRAPGRQLEHAGAVGVEPQLGDEPPPELLRREPQLETRTGPRTVRSSRARPSGACAAKSSRCSFENSLRTGSSSASAAFTSVRGIADFSVPEHTKPPGSGARPPPRGSRATASEHPGAVTPRPRAHTGAWRLVRPSGTDCGEPLDAA